MLTDGLQFLSTSIASKLTIESGSILPTGLINTGELFYLTGANQGLYTYNGTNWIKPSENISLIGDVIASGLTGENTSISLLDVGTAGIKGSASSIPVFVTDAKGRVTSNTNTLISIQESQVSNGNLLARVADVESITGAWTFRNASAEADPTTNQHIATKQYVDSVAAGLDPKGSVRATTTANITLSGLQTLDGVLLVSSNRVLVKNQTIGSQNGIYVASISSWTRSADFDGTPTAEVSSGAFTFVTEGTLSGDTGWVLTTNDPIITGSTAQVWTQFSASGAGAAGSLSGTTLAPNIVSSSLTSVGTLGSLSVSGIISGVGSGLTALNATNLSSGTVSSARLGTGTASATTYLRGDGTWGISQANFIQSGSGTIQRTLQDKNREIVSITDFLGADPTGMSDSSVAVNSAMMRIGTSGTIYIPEGIFIFNIDLGASRINFKGAGIGKTFIKSYTIGLAPIIYGGNATWDFVYIEDMTVCGDPGSQNKNGIQFGRGEYAANDEFAGRVIFNKVKFVDLDKCISRLYGNIGVYFTHCYFSTSNFHLWSKGTSNPLMHGGCSMAKWCHFDSAKLAVCYIDSGQDGTGQFITEDCVIEGNPGFVFFIKNFNDAAIGEGFIIRAAWNEGNCTAASVVIDGLSYVPKHIYANNCTHLRIEDTTMGPVQLINSNMTTENCQLDFMSLSMDNSSSCFHDNAIYDSGRNYVGQVRSIKIMRRQAGNFASYANIQHRRYITKVSPGKVLYQNQFNAPVLFTGTINRNSTNADDGVLVGQTVVQDFILNAGENEFPSGSIFNISSGKYYAWFFTYRLITGTSASMSIVYNTALVGGINLNQQDWTTVGGITDTVGMPNLPNSVSLYLTGGLNTSTIRMGAFAVVEFNTRQTALEFINDRNYPI